MIEQGIIQIVGLICLVVVLIAVFCFVTKD